MNLRQLQLTYVSSAALQFLSLQFRVAVVDALYISLQAGKVVFEPITQCWAPLMREAGADTFINRTEYASFVQRYIDFAENKHQHDDEDENSVDYSEFKGHAHGRDECDIVVNSFNGRIDPYEEVFNKTFDELINYCRTTEICDKDYDEEAFPVFADDVDSGKSIIGSGSIMAAYLFVVCDKTVERINDVYDSFGRSESFQVDFDYQFYSAINKTEIADVMIYQWDKFLREVEVSHAIGYDKTSVEVTGNCDVEEEGVKLVEDTDREIKCYEVTLSMEARTDKKNPMTNEEVAAEISPEIRDAVEKERLGFACQDSGCRIAMYLSDDDEERSLPGVDGANPIPPKPKNFLPLYISMGGAAFVGIIVGGVLGARRCRGRSSASPYARANSVEIDFPLRVPNEDEEVMIEDDHTGFDVNSTHSRE